jgi:hypothetical protein
VEPEKPPADEWWETWRERQWHRERPRIRDLLRENPIGPPLYLIFLCGFFIGPYISDPGGLGIRPLFAIPLGILTGAIVWWLLMLGFAKGWVQDE